MLNGLRQNFGWAEWTFSKTLLDKDLKILNK